MVPLSDDLVIVPATTTSTHPPRPRLRRGRRRNSVIESQAVAVAVIAGVAAAFTSDAAPTGALPTDAALVALAVAAVTYAGASASWGLLLVAAAAAAAAALDPRWTVAGVVAGALALIVGWRRRNQSTLRAMSAGVTMVVLANSQLEVRFGLSAAIAGVVGGVLLVGGLRRRPSRVRRRAWLALAAVALLAVAAVGALGAAAWTSRAALAGGRASAEAGLRAVRAGDYEGAAELFAEAARQFGDANQRLEQPWALPASAVPVVAQHRRLALDLSADGAAASQVAADALAAVDIDRLRLEGGRIDVEAIAELATPLHDLDRALESMSTTVNDESSPWLLPQLDEALGDLRSELAEADARLDDAALAVAVAPKLLGAEGERRYLVVFTTPVEARALGFPGNYAELVVDGGRMTMAEFGRMSTLEQRGMELGVRLTGPQELLDQYRPFILRSDLSVAPATWRNMTMTPDFPKVAEAMADLYQQITGRPVDGVMVVDPYVVATLIGYTGPVELPSAGVTLDRSNALQYILIDQYAATESVEGNADRIDALEEAAEAMMGALLSGALPNPVQLADDLAPLVDDDRVMFWTADPESSALLQRVGIDGALPERDGADGFVMTVANASGSKIEYFLDRAIAYDAETDAGGTTMATLTATLTNTAPTTGYPDYVIGNVIGMPVGSSRLYVSLFSPLELRHATVNGEYRSMSIGFEGDWNVYSTFVTVPAGESVTLELELGGRVAEPGRVVTWEQPLVRPADVRISARVLTPTVAPA